MFSGWPKTFLARMLSSTAAVALGAASSATLLSPSAANATIIIAPGGDTPQDATAAGTIHFGDSISFAQAPPEYWEFTWGGPVATADISSNGSFAGGIEPNPFGNLELYSVAGQNGSGWETSLLDSTAFQTSGSFASADLGTLPLTVSDDYVVGISDPPAEFATGTITFGAVPEPASLPLLAGALAALGLLRRRRKLRG
jgi:hypothetical protein